MDENKSKSKPSFSSLGVVTILGILALVALVAIPNFIRARTDSASNACVNNLRNIEAAKQQWGLENNKTNLDDIVTWNDVTPYLGRGVSGSLVSIYCPKDQSKQCSNSYTLGNLSTKPKCKIRPSEDIIN